LKGEKEKKEDKENEEDHIPCINNTPEKIIGSVKQGQS